MIVLPRSVARCCRAVFKRLASSRTTRGRPLMVGLIGGPEGLRLRAATGDAAAEFLHPGTAEECRLSLPLDALAECEGAGGDVVLKPLGDTRVELTWQKAGKEQRREYAAGAVPDFPACPGGGAVNGPELLAAMDRGSETAAQEGTRFALHRVLLRGRKGEVIGTDGKQLLIEGGFTFPFQGDLLVPRVSVFGAAELPREGEVLVAQSSPHVLFRAGPWTFALKVAEGERYPPVDAVVPRAAAEATRWRLGPGEAGLMVRTLAALPGGNEDHAPVTVDLTRDAVLRAKASGQTRPTEVPLTRSSAEGKPVKFSTDRRFLSRACAMGFDSFGVVGAGQPVVCGDGRRTYLWMSLDRNDALPAHPHPVRVTLGGVVPQRDGGSASPVAARRASRSASRTAVSPASRPIARPEPAGWLLRFSLWGWQLRRLAGLVADQRRRERQG